jgi:hypothetical protein
MLAGPNRAFCRSVHVPPSVMPEMHGRSSLAAPEAAVWWCYMKLDLVGGYRALAESKTNRGRTRSNAYCRIRG